MSDNEKEKEFLDKEKSKKNEKDKKKKKSNSNLKIIEWRYNQFLGEKLTYDQIKEDPENETFLITDIKFCQDGENLVVTDKGDRGINF